MRQYKDCLRDLFSEHLHEYRINNALTQEEIADELSIIPNAVSDLERKVFAPSSVTLMLFLGILDNKDRACFIDQFCDKVNMKKSTKKGGEFSVEKITVSEYIENPESVYIMCAEHNRIIRITNGEQGCVMMSDRLWNLVEETYNLCLYGGRRKESEKAKAGT